MEFYLPTKGLLPAPWRHPPLPEANGYATHQPQLLNHSISAKNSLLIPYFLFPLAYLYSQMCALQLSEIMELTEIAVRKVFVECSSIHASIVNCFLRQLLCLFALAANSRWPLWAI